MTAEDRAGLRSDKLTATVARGCPVGVAVDSIAFRRAIVRLLIGQANKR
jgi:hypothetical protein